MMAKENARPRRQPEAGCGAGQDWADHVPVSDYNGFDRVSQQSGIQKFLGHGKSNAISGRKLLELFGGKDLRTVSKAVECARRAGIPVCATTSPDGPGYYIAANADELSNYIHSLDHRLKEIRVTRSFMGDALAAMTGQTAIRKWGD